VEQLDVRRHGLMALGLLVLLDDHVHVPLSAAGDPVQGAADGGCGPATKWAAGNWVRNAAAGGVLLVLFTQLRR
jgi:hypothetical protein